MITLVSQKLALPAASIDHSSTGWTPRSAQVNSAAVIGWPLPSNGKPVPVPERRRAYFNWVTGVWLSSAYCRKSVAHNWIICVGMMFTLRPKLQTTAGALQSLMTNVYAQVLISPSFSKRHSMRCVP